MSRHKIRRAVPTAHSRIIGGAPASNPEGEIMARQKRNHFGARMILFVPAYPIAVAAFRSNRVMPQSHHLAYLVHQPELGFGHHRFKARPGHVRFSTPRITLTSMGFAHMLLPVLFRLLIISLFVHQYQNRWKTFPLINGSPLHAV